MAKESDGSLKEKVKKELGYMKEGAKVVPKVIAKKGKKWFKGQVEAAKERVALERKIQQEAKAAEREAYKEERMKQAKIRGIAKAKKRATGFRGALAELGQIGDRMSVGRTLGIGDIEEKSKKGSPVSDFLFSGLGEKKKKKK